MATPNDNTLNSRLSRVEGVLSSNVGLVRSRLTDMMIDAKSPPAPLMAVDSTGAQDVGSRINGYFAKYASVYLPDGTYGVSTTITIPPYCKLSLSPNAVLIPLADVDMVYVQNKATLEGGRINCGSLTTMTKSAVIVKGVDKHYHNTTIKDIEIAGTYNNTGKGLSLVCLTSGDFITFIKVSNVHIYGCQYGLYMYTPDLNSWVNGNEFSKLSLNVCYYPLYMDGSCSGNDYNGYQIQVTPETVKALYCAGTFNNFKGMIWDVGGNGLTTKAIELTSTSSYNQFNQTLRNYEGFIIDNGRSNRFGEDYTKSVMPMPSSDVKAFQGTGYLNNFLGNQDDFLAYADKRFTITQTSGPAANNFANAFDPLATSALQFSAPGTSQVIFTIDTTADVLYYLGVLGIQFQYNTYPTYVKIETAPLSGVYSTFSELTNNMTDLVIIDAGNSIPYDVHQIRFTFQGINPNNTQNKFIIRRIFGTSLARTGKTYVTRSGGLMYGDLDLNKNKMKNMVIDQAVTASRPTTPTMGQMFYDTTIKKPIWWNGTAWKDGSDTTV